MASSYQGNGQRLIRSLYITSLGLNNASVRAINKFSRQIVVWIPNAKFLRNLCSFEDEYFVKQIYAFETISLRWIFGKWDVEVWT
jgi:hypothetical protein